MWTARPQCGGSGWVGWPRPYDLSFVDGLRGLCVVGIVFCLNQDFQDYRIFRIVSHQLAEDSTISIVRDNKIGMIVRQPKETINRVI